jgi:hypothetical protein
MVGGFDVVDDSSFGGVGVDAGDDLCNTPRCRIKEGGAFRCASSEPDFTATEAEQVWLEQSQHGDRVVRNVP